jgi:hypothetical protein
MQGAPPTATIRTAPPAPKPDEIYTTIHNNACYRFDLVRGEVSGGARDMTTQQLDAIRKRLESILDTVQFDDK